MATVVVAQWPLQGTRQGVQCSTFCPRLDLAKSLQKEKERERGRAEEKKIRKSKKDAKKGLKIS